jgi:hypothetical protein
MGRRPYYEREAGKMQEALGAEQWGREGELAFATHAR